MKKVTLEKMQIDSTLSVIKRMAAGCLLKTKKRNGHRNLPLAAKNLHSTISMSLDEALEYVITVAGDADDRECTG